MSKQDYTITFLVDQTPMQVFNAVNNVRGWWSELLEGDSQKVGDEFSYRHGDIHYSRHRITESVPGKKVVWLVTESDLDFVKKRDEWVGTTNVFDICEKDGKTELTFTHIGLSPAIDCFESCSGGWDYYLKGSLLPLITTGVGKPDKTGDEQI